MTSADGAKTLYIPCKPNTTYTVSKILSGRFAVCTTNVQPVQGQSTNIYGRIVNLAVTNITITTDANAQYLCVFYYYASADTLTEQQILDTIQIETGDVAHAYSQYGVPPIELCEIENYRDYFYRDNNFKWFLRKEIGKARLNSTYLSSGGTTGTNAYYINTNITAFNNNAMELSCSNMFLPCSFNDRVNGLDVTYVQNGVLVLRTKNNTSLDWSDNTKRGDWLNENQPIVYYVLATPTNTEITKENYPVLYEQLYSLDKAVTYIDQTNFFVEGDLPVKLDVTAFQNNITGKVGSQNLLLSDVNSSYTPMSSFTEFSSSQEITNQNIMQTVSRTTTTLYGENDDNTGLVQSVSTNSSKIVQNEDNIALIFEDTHQLADRTGTLEANTADVVNQFVFGDDGLTISNKGSTSQDMRLNLTNDQIQFLYQNNVVLKINGSAIEFSNASFEKLDLGHYVWQAEDDNSLSLIYEA